MRKFMSQIEIPDIIKQKLNNIKLRISGLEYSTINYSKDIIEDLFEIKDAFESLTKPTKFLNINTEDIYNIATFCDYFHNFELSKYFYRLYINVNPSEKLDKAWNNLGIALDKLNKPTEAEASFRSALSINNEYLNAWNNLGKLLISLKRFTRAETAFKKMIEIDSENIQGLIGLGGILANLGKYNESKEIFEKSLLLCEDNSPDKAEIIYGLGLILEHDKKVHEALEYYNKVIRINENHIDAWNRIGIINLDSIKSFDEARKAFKKIIDVDSSNSPAWNNLGLVNKREGKIKEAEDAYREAIYKNSKYTIAYNNLGVLLKDSKQFEEAEQVFQKAIELDPNNDWIKSNLEFIQQVKMREEKKNRLERKKKIY
jgi:superkiller protein 3